MTKIAPCALLLLLATGQSTPVRQPDQVPEFEGLIEPSRVVRLSSSVDGLLETVSVDRGDFVRQGQTVATLESRVERATLELTKARTELVAELKGEQARLEFAVGKLAQAERLYTKGVLSVEEFDLRKTEKLMAESRVLGARESLRLAGLEKRRAEAALELRTIRSPFDGVVVERYLSPGELVTRQYQSKIIAVAQVDPLSVEVFLPETMFGKIAVDSEAIVKVKHLVEGGGEDQAHEAVGNGESPRVPLSGGVSRARVKAVDQVIDASSSTFRVHLEMSNPDNRLTAGLKCGVQFPE